MPAARNSTSAGMLLRRRTRGRPRQVLAPHAAELRIVTNQVGELAALLHEVAPRQARDLLLEPRRAMSSLSTSARVVEAEGLVEVGGHEEMLRRGSLSW